MARKQAEIPPSKHYADLDRLLSDVASLGLVLGTDHVHRPLPEIVELAERLLEQRRTCGYPATMRVLVVAEHPEHLEVYADLGTDLEVVAPYCTNTHIHPRFQELYDNKQKYRLAPNAWSSEHRP